MQTIQTNEDFLKTIFGDQWQRAHVCQFPQPPDDGIVKDGRWTGMSAAQANGQLSMSEWNQFYTVSLFHPDPSGRSKRTKELFEAQYALVLDDLGSGAGAKIPMSALEGKPLPQYAIETSLDNWQIIYLFDHPVTDPDVLAGVIDALISQGLSADSDPGFKGVTRYVRMPLAVNNKLKYGETFNCRIIPIDPDNRVSIPQLIDGWGLDVVSSKSSRAAVSTPEQVENSLTYKLLSQHNLWTGEQANGYWGTPCPQQDQHTIDDGQHGINLQTGEYKCHHGSCEGLNRGDLETWLIGEYPEESVGEIFGEPIGEVAPGLDQFVTRAVMLSSDQVDEANAIVFEASKVLNAGKMDRLYDALYGGGFAKGPLKADLRSAQQASRGLSRTVVAAEGDICGTLAQNYLFVQGVGKYFNLTNKESCVGSSFDVTYMEPNGEGGPGISAQIRFKEEGGVTVKNIQWRPWAYFGDPEYIINPGTEFSAANLYMPPPVIEPHQDDSRIVLWTSLFEHLIPSREEREVYKDHMAFTLQHPETKIQWQILHIGQKRIGKDAILYPMIQFMAKNASEIDLDDEAAKWGDTKSGKKALVFSEVFRPQDKGFENQLKTMAASTSSGKGWVNMKGGQMVEQQNLYSIYAMSNYENCMHLDPEDARWFAISSLEVKKLTPVEYAMVWSWMKEGTGVTDVAGWLLGRDVSDFSVGTMPYHTEAYRDISAASLSNLASMLADAKDQELGPFGMSVFAVSDVMDYLKQSGWERAVNRSLLANELKLIGCHKLQNRARKTIDGKRMPEVRLYTNLRQPQIERCSSVELYDSYISAKAGVKFAFTEDIDSGGEV